MKKEAPIEIEISKVVLRLYAKSRGGVEVIFIGKDGKEYSPRYYAEYGREYQPLDIQEL